MKQISKIILSCLMILYCFLIVRYKPWEAFMGKTYLWDLILASTLTIILVGLIICALGLIAGKKYRKWFIFFNVAYFAFGVYVTHVSWTLWIFRTPTLLDRIKISIMPFALGVILPIAVAYYFTKIEK